MKHLTKVSLVAATAVAVTFGSSVYAFADWIVATPPTVLRMRVADMPAGSAPSVARNGKNAAIDWVGNKIAPGVKVESYVVTRFGAGNPVVVCDRVTATSCKDKLVPGGTWTWRVRPVLATWLGVFSADSAALTFSGPPPTAAELVSATSPAAPMPPGASPGAATVVGSAPGGDAGVVTSPPAAHAGAEPPAVAGPEPEEPDAPPSDPQESTPDEPAAPSTSPSADGKE
jgi:hypothetical protein